VFLVGEEVMVSDIPAMHVGDRKRSAGWQRQTGDASVLIHGGAGEVVLDADFVGFGIELRLTGTGEDILVVLAGEGRANVVGSELGGVSSESDRGDDVRSHSGQGLRYIDGFDEPYVFDVEHQA
jgi:hypothetical protein